MKLTWDESQSTGIAEIDNQHKRLVIELNALMDAMRKGAGKEQLSKTLEFLGEYVQKHFQDEEKCFDKFKCPFAGENKRAHQEFLATFTKLKADFDEQGPTLPLIIRVENEIGGWYLRHVKGVDCKLKTHLSKSA
jgi:hemerythrin